MSCWVVPTVAAELWGISVESILQAIRSNQVASKQENGFTFIDVAPHSPVMEKPRSLRAAPPTYRVVTHDEFVALVADLMADEDEAAVDEWRSGRAEAGRMRRPPESTSDDATTVPAAIAA